MGEVYLAQDTRLGRKVAIKVLPEEYAGNPERLARFEQEARAAATLNHPHIAVVHDIGFEEGGAATEAKTDPGIGAGQAAAGPDAVEEPGHVRKLSAREPGDLVGVC